LANHKSAEKRARQSAAKYVRNKSIRTKMRNVIKKIRMDAEAGKNPMENMDAAKSVIDKAARKGVIHKRSAARKISRLSKLVISKS